MLKPLKIKESTITIINPEIVEETIEKAIDGPRIAGQIPSMVILCSIENYLIERTKNKKLPPQETLNLIACYGLSRDHNLMLVYCRSQNEAKKTLKIWKSVPECQAFTLKEFETKVEVSPINIAA